MPWSERCVAWSTCGAETSLDEPTEALPGPPGSALAGVPLHDLTVEHEARMVPTESRPGEGSLRPGLLVLSGAAGRPVCLFLGGRRRRTRPTWALRSRGTRSARA